MRPNLSYSLIETGPMVCLIRVPSMRIAMAHLILVVAVHLPQKGGDVVGLNAGDRRAGQVFVNGCQICLPPEHDVGGVLALIDAPVILDPEVAKDRAEPVGKLIQFPVNPLGLPAVGDTLRLSPIPDLDNSVIPQAVVDFALLQLPRQPVMSVEVDLQTAGQPGGDTDVGQP